MTTTCFTARFSTRPLRLSTLTRALLAAGLVAALPVAAQQAPAQPASAPAVGSATLDPVVITANKRKEKQREVAGTVSVIQGDDLERRGARDQEDTLKLTPGVQVNKGDPGTNIVTIRGLGTIAATEGGGGQQDPTGFYLEDVPLVFSVGKVVVDILPFDLDRVEVLRGPQGALFGSGSLGGAIRYLYAKPNLTTVEASALADVSHAWHGGTGISGYAMVNAPLANGAAGLRVVAFDRTDPGYIDNLGTGKKNANEVHQRGGRVLFTVKPSQDFTATLVASTQKTERDDRFFVSPDPDKLEHRAPTDGAATSRFDFSSLTMDYDIGGHTLTSITGWWKTKNSGRGDDTELFASLGLVAPLVARTFDDSSHATSQELRIASKPGGRWSYVAGVFYQRGSASSVGTQSTPGFNVFPGAPEVLVDLSSSAGGTEKAVFADAEYALGGGWSVGLGGRYYRTSTHFRQDGAIFGAPSNSDPPDGNDHGTTPKASVKYRFGDNLWYALASKGYRYGGVNASPPFLPYKSDSVWNYETGVRLAPARDLLIDLTAFFLDWKNAQFTVFDTSGALPFAAIENVGKARSKGLEAATRYKINSIFDVAASLAYIDARTAADFVDSTGATIPSGSRLPGTALWQTALQANVRFAGPLDSQGRFSATETHVGSRVADISGFHQLPSFNTLDLGLSLARENWTVAANLINALDGRGIMSITGSPFGGPFQQYFPQRPRTLSVTVRYDY